MDGQTDGRTVRSSVRPSVRPSVRLLDGVLTAADYLVKPHIYWEDRQGTVSTAIKT